MLFHRDTAVVVSLALQGGGAHGAFTWGVLDALLEDGRFHFEGISGTSAGAMNAVALAQGWMDGGAEGARAMLARFWEGLASGSPSDLRGDSMPGVAAGWVLSMSRWLSPYQFNPFNLNPLRKLVEGLFDFERLQQDAPFQLFVAATHANSGQLRLFRNTDLSADALLASACLPQLHQAIMIGGEPYWDGAYAANPAVFPLLRFCAARDILLVLLAPMRYAQTPRSAEDIQRRCAELGFTSGFVREMRLLAAMRDMSGEGGWLAGPLEHRLRSLRVHLLDGEEVLGALDAASRATTNLAFLRSLRDAGRARAQCWLERHGDAPGHRASVAWERIFLPE